MTCFSIQKKFVFGLCLALSWVLLGSVPRAEEVVQADREESKTDAPIVVELFTTIDCTTCVFADRVLYDSMKDKNVIALSCLTKDISDVEKIENGKAEAVGRAEYDGPMDPCVFRQWAYKGGKTSRDTTIELPLFVLNGYDLIDGANTNYYSQILRSYDYSYKNKAIDIFMEWKDADTISIHLPQMKEKSEEKSASLWLIRYKDIEIAKVNEGINKGRVLRFSNVIQTSQHIGKWHGQTRTIDFDVPAPQGGDERGGYVVLSQAMMGEPVLAAGKLEDYALTKDRTDTPAQSVPQAKINPN